jgi:predicted acylesterase/phospholipase RssA/CRP-like cAMP-binding protein
MEDRNESLRAVLGRAFLREGETLDDAVFDDLLAELRWVHLHGKEVLFEEGAPSESLFVIASGRLRAVGPDPSGKAFSRDLVAGEMFGEMGVISGDPRSMTVYAVRDSALTELPKAAVEGLMSRHPQLMKGILNTVISRLRGASASSSATSCFALAAVPLSKGPALEGFARRLADAFGEMGSTRLLDREATGGREGEALVAWLNALEESNRFLVYAADPADPEWTARCVRQADHVLLVAEPASDPEPGDWERELLWRDHGPTSARRSLALVHDDPSRRPSGTGRWLDPRELHRHYHLRLGDPGEFGRLARSLSDHGVGLVLGGGGARGFSQVGVIRAMRESGIPIDFVGGTSMGAIVAAACAMGWDTPTMIALGREAFVDSKAFSEYTLPIVSLLRGNRLERVTRKIFGETQIEDLWIPQFSVSCNVSTSAPVIHQRGPLWKAVRASGSLPGVLPPVLDDRQLLVDGGVLDNLPGDVMRGLSGGPVVVVDVTPKQDLLAPCDTVPSPWQILRHRLFSKGEPCMPGMVDILMRATTLTSVRLANEVKGDADLYLHPPVEAFGMLEFDAVERIAAIGYDYTLQRIEEWGGPAKVRELLGLA